jgi:thiol-disulfide isomerase/thioredoxin
MFRPAALASSATRSRRGGSATYFSPRSRRGRWCLTALLLAIGLLAGCGSAATPNADTPPALIAAADRAAAPVVTGELLDGTGTYDLSAHSGDVVVINFWGSWCGPCVAESGALEQTYQATRANGVSFVGINVRDSRDEAQHFASIRLTYPSIFDPASKVALGFTVPPSTPSTYVVDRHGRIALILRRAVLQTELEPLVTQLAAEAA